MLALAIILTWDAFVYSTLFMVLYIVGGLTDQVDGPLARRWKVTSTLGNNLDSIGDFLFAGVGLILVIPVMPYLHNPLIIIMVSSIFVIKIAAVIVPYIKFKKAISLHTYLSKGVAWLAFLFPIAHWIGHYRTDLYINLGINEMHILFVVASLVIIIMLEELMIHILAKEPKPHAKGFLFDRKK